MTVVEADLVADSAYLRYLAAIERAGIEGGEIDAYLKAWSRWNDLPADHGRVVAMEQAAVPLAGMAGLTVTELRRRVNVACAIQLRTGPHRNVFDPRAAVLSVLREALDGWHRPPETSSGG